MYLFTLENHNLLINVIISFLFSPFNYYYLYLGCPINPQNLTEIIELCSATEPCYQNVFKEYDICSCEGAELITTHHSEFVRRDLCSCGQCFEILIFFFQESI